jgi:hypothetical protein
MLFEWFLIGCLAIQTTRTESWPDGSPRAEYEVERDAEGLEQKHGRFRSFHAGGGLESEGRFEHGKQNGPWSFRHADGTLAAKGSFADGLESGPWETFHANGKPASKGGYVRGARDGRWTFWSAEGAKDLAASGIHKLEVYRSKEDGRHYRGYFVDNLRQGPWTSHWPDKSVQLEGSFAGGKRDGAWTFRHPDGVASSLLFTGRYVGGAWDGTSAVPEPPPFDPARFPALEPSPLGWPADREGLTAALQLALRDRTLSQELATRLSVAGLPALPVVLELVRRLDPESAEDRRALGFLETTVLRHLCAGHALSRHGIGGPPDAPAARELVRAWLSLWLLTRHDLAFWQVDVPGPARGAGLRDVLQDPPIFELDRRHASAEVVERPGSEAAGALRPAYRFRFGRAKEERYRYAPPGTEESIARALRWLVAHQSPDGRWSIDGFAKECGKLGKEPCTGPGATAHDVGASALALLAFLGDGHTPLAGAQRESVTRGLDWLVRQQASEGLVGERNTHDFLYGHAMATAALCEAAGMGAEALRAPAERALAFLLFARNPDAGWRYDVPPIGQSDTSVTGWAVQALLAARAAGFAVDDAPFVGALSWIERMSSVETGRVGYSDRGELSARMTSNQDFPRELGEAMTGVGLLLRLLLGQTPTEQPILLEHARLIASKPPAIDPQWGGDQYYWYYATLALHEYGAPFWDAWELALRKTVILEQEKRGEAEGSWAPIGPWGTAMGRVCSTALMTLALECFARYPRALEAPK